jgi:hypothetical protein
MAILPTPEPTPTPVPTPPIPDPKPMREPDPDRLPDENPVPNPDENDIPPKRAHGGCQTSGGVRTAGPRIHAPAVRRVRADTRLRPTFETVSHGTAGETSLMIFTDRRIPRRKLRRWTGDVNVLRPAYAAEAASIIVRYGPRFGCVDRDVASFAAGSMMPSTRMSGGIEISASSELRLAMTIRTPSPKP